MKVTQLYRNIGIREILFYIMKICVYFKICIRYCSLEASLFPLLKSFLVSLSIGVDWCSHPDILLTRCRIWCAHCICQLQQIWQQLLQVIDDSPKQAHSNITSCCFHVVCFSHCVTGSRSSRGDANLSSWPQWPGVNRTDKVQARKACQMIAKGFMLIGWS